MTQTLPAYVQHHHASAAQQAICGLQARCTPSRSLFTALPNAWHSTFSGRASAFSKGKQMLLQHGMWQCVSCPSTYIQQTAGVHRRFVCDELDGRFARMLDQSTMLGQVLDMVTDRCAPTCHDMHAASPHCAPSEVGVRPLLQATCRSAVGRRPSLLLRN